MSLLKPDYRRENIRTLFTRTIWSMNEVHETYDRTFARLKSFRRKRKYSDFELHNRALSTSFKLLNY
jgi:hypothetical protein